MKYNAEIADKIIELYSTGKQSLQDICAVVNISRETFYEWKKKREKFCKAVEHAHVMRLDAIREMAISGLALLVTKHEYEEVTTEYTEGPKGADGKPTPKIKSRKVTKKFIMPNPGMITLALTNLQSDDFKNKQDINHSGEIKNITVRIE